MIPPQILAVLAIVGLLAVAGGMTILPSAEVISGSSISCTPQPLYGWVTCQSVPQPQATQRVEWGGLFSSYKAYQCPQTSDISDIKGCTIIAGAPDLKGIYKGRSCSEQNVGFVKQWVCSDGQPVVAGTALARGDYLYAGTQEGTDDVTLQIYKKELRDCGLAACSNSGTPVPGAAGCTWKPAGSSLLNGFGFAVDTVPEGQSYKYQTGTISSCTSSCTFNIDCRPPTNSVSGVTVYNGQQTPWYAYGTQGYYLGCLKQQTCVKKDNFGNCLENQDFGYCGTLGAFSTGQCTQNSDCGDVTRFSCDFSQTTLQGTCKPREEVSTQTCSFDFRCSQTGLTCNNKVKGTSKCISGTCQVIQTTVQCCSVSDCGAGQFCNGLGVCENAPQQAPPTGQPLPPAEEKPLDVLTIIAAILGGFILAVIILGIIVAAAFLLPPVRAIAAPLMNARNFAVAALILGIVFAALFTASALTAASLVIG